nr:hypothetical protein [Rhodococcus maanshanensis]
MDQFIEFHEYRVRFRARGVLHDKEYENGDERGGRRDEWTV